MAEKMLHKCMLLACLTTLLCCESTAMLSSGQLLVEFNDYVCQWEMGEHKLNTKCVLEYVNAKTEAREFSSHLPAAVLHDPLLRNYSFEVLIIQIGINHCGWKLGGGDETFADYQRRVWRILTNSPLDREVLLCMKVHWSTALGLGPPMVVSDGHDAGSLFQYHWQLWPTVAVDHLVDFFVRHFLNRDCGRAVEGFAAESSIFQPNFDGMQPCLLRFVYASSILPFYEAAGDDIALRNQRIHQMLLEYSKTECAVPASDEGSSVRDAADVEAKFRLYLNADSMYSVQARKCLVTQFNNYGAARWCLHLPIHSHKLRQRLAMIASMFLLLECADVKQLRSSVDDSIAVEFEDATSATLGAPRSMLSRFVRSLSFRYAHFRQTFLPSPSDMLHATGSAIKLSGRVVTAVAAPFAYHYGCDYSWLPGWFCPKKPEILTGERA